MSPAVMLLLGQALAGSPSGEATYLRPYRDGAVFEVLAAPGRLVDIVLEPGERLAANGPIAAGDTARWIIGDAVSGSAGEERVHVLVKPVALGLSTNLVINTSRRTYYLNLRSVVVGAEVSPRISWLYPQPPVVLVAAPPAPAPAAEPHPLIVNAAYRIKGPRVAWRPARVFDDGRRTYLEFPGSVAPDELPPLFATGPDGKAAELINYRRESARLVVDRLLIRAELRLGQGRTAQRVRIIREAAR